MPCSYTLGNGIVTTPANCADDNSAFAWSEVGENAAKAAGYPLTTYHRVFILSQNLVCPW